LIFQFPNTDILTTGISEKELKYSPAPAQCTELALTVLTVFAVDVMLTRLRHIHCFISMNR
jgi:hypothetical protein